MADPSGDDEAFARYSSALADAIDSAIGPWVLRVVAERCAAAGITQDDTIRVAADTAARECRTAVVPQIRVLLGTDLDEQRTTPLALLRRAIVYPTAVLAAAGVPPVARDEFAVRSFPDDVYALSPASFGDIDESVHEPGLVWGAAKAHVHLSRRAAGG